MVIHGFGDESDARHVAEGRDEVLTLKRAMELAVFKSPAFVLDKPLLKFRVREFVRGHDSNLLQWTSRAVRDAPPHYHGSSSARQGRSASQGGAFCVARLGDFLYRIRLSFRKLPQRVCAPRNALGAKREEENPRHPVWRRPDRRLHREIAARETGCRNRGGH